MSTYEQLVETPTHPPTGSLLQIRPEIQNWDLERPRRRMVTELGIDESQMLAIEHEYRRYMSLLADHEGTCLPPSASVDQFWHAHIIFTRDYTNFSLAVFGSYLHHEPGGSDADRLRHQDAYYTGTLRLYRRHFGEPPSNVWPQERRDGDGADCASSCEAGNCR